MRALSWQPALAAAPSGEIPLYIQVADAMEQDVRAGRLLPGARLPPHRDLAFALGISVGSVTKAYGEAMRRGLLDGQVGRGSYIRSAVPIERSVAVLSVAADERQSSAVEERQSSMIDLSCNVPVHSGVSDQVARAVAQLAASGRLDISLEYAQCFGRLQVRETGVAWLRRQHGLEVRAHDVVHCNGGQHAMALALSALCRNGDVVLCEELSYYGIRVIARQLGLGLRGVAMDAEGLAPEAFEQALMATRARVLVTLPSIQNPTTRTMSAGRRAAIAEIARRHDVTIIEDDAYRSYLRGPEVVSPIYAFAPERTFYIASVSKNIAPGLRLGFMVLPEKFERERLLRAVRAFGLCPPGLGGLVFSQWVEDGTADLMVETLMNETAARLEIAREIFGNAMVEPQGGLSPHIWLPLSALAAERAAARALRGGVDLMVPHAYLVNANPGADMGLRPAICAAPDRETLRRGLTIVAAAMQEGDIGDGGV